MRLLHPVLWHRYQYILFTHGLGLGPRIIAVRRFYQLYQQVRCNYLFLFSCRTSGILQVQWICRTPPHLVRSASRAHTAFFLDLAILTGKLLVSHHLDLAIFSSLCNVLGLQKSHQLYNSSTWYLAQKRRRAVLSQSAEVTFLDRNLSSKNPIQQKQALQQNTFPARILRSLVPILPAS